MGYHDDLNCKNILIHCKRDAVDNHSLVVLRYHNILNHITPPLNLKKDGIFRFPAVCTGAAHILTHACLLEVLSIPGLCYSKNYH